MEKRSQQLIQDLEYRAKNIDKMMQWALVSQNRYLSNKYANVQATISFLKSLIQKFTKKAQKYQNKLRKTARIQQIFYQTNFHKNRIQQCEKISQNIIEEINKKRQQINKYQERAQVLRRKLIIIKTDNVKTILKIQQIEKKNHIQQKKQSMNFIRRSKQNKQKQNRQTMNYQYSINPLDKIKRQKQEIQVSLFQMIDHKIKINNFIQQCFKILKDKLIQNQKKSSLDGLSGSLIFKIKKNQKQFKIQKRSNDSKLLIYNILKEKHQTIRKQQQKKCQKIQLPKQTFMKFTPLQIIGIIQLLGGFQKLKQKVPKKQKIMLKNS